MLILLVPEASKECLSDPLTIVWTSMLHVSTTIVNATSDNACTFQQSNNHTINAYGENVWNTVAACVPLFPMTAGLSLRAKKSYKHFIKKTSTPQNMLPFTVYAVVNARVCWWHLTPACLNGVIEAGISPSYSHGQKFWQWHKFCASETLLLQFFSCVCGRLKSFKDSYW